MFKTTQEARFFGGEEEEVPVGQCNISGHVGVGIDTRKNDTEDDNLPPFVVCCLLFSAAAAVTALTTLYGDLDQPAQLSHWNASGGDPCTQNWQGAICSGSNITELYVISS